MTEGTANEHTPDYYRGENAMQPLDVIDSWKLDFYLGNAVKYLVRWRGKHGRQDLGKAAHYLDLAVERARRKPSWVDAHNVDLPRTRIKGLTPYAVITAFGLQGAERDVIYLLFEWADQGCCGCLLSARDVTRELFAQAEESTADAVRKNDAERLAAAEAFAAEWDELIAQLPDSYGCHLTCVEADLASDFYIAMGRPKTADAIIGAHAEYDAPGDLHFDDDPEAAMSEPGESIPLEDLEAEFGDADDPGNGPDAGISSVPPRSEADNPSGDHGH